MEAEVCLHTQYGLPSEGLVDLIICITFDWKAKAIFK